MAAALLPLVLPVLAVLVVFVRGDGGPGLVRLERVGRNGRRFRMWKVRSMKQSPGASRAQGAVLTAGDGDLRVTPLGRRLRRWHLDEIAQLLDVVSGHMALLGPRPETPEYVDADDPRWQAVLAAPPGIGGPTQVVVRQLEAILLAASTDDDDDVYRDVLLPLKLAIDEWYVQNASAWIDVLLVIALVEQLALGRDRTVLHTRIETALPQLTVGTNEAGLPAFDAAVDG